MTNRGASKKKKKGERSRIMSKDLEINFDSIFFSIFFFIIIFTDDDNNDY
jgi:hypothetical protein